MNEKSPLKLLYLGFALPDEVAAKHPQWNPAGQGFESALLKALAHSCDIQSISLTSFCSKFDYEKLENDRLVLLDDKDGRINSFDALLGLYRQYTERFGPFDYVMVYNLSPVYNKFIKWLRAQHERPKLILLLADSAQLGESLSWIKRFRYRFKPWVWLDEAMLPCFDAAICLSPYVTKVFREKTQNPAVWMPGAVSLETTTPKFTALTTPRTPPCLGYFGSLSAYSGILDFARMFLSINTPFRLEVRGDGRQAVEIAKLAEGSNGRLKYHNFEGGPSDAVRMAQERWDVLLNPRRALYGNRNNFASKIFQYTLVGRPILTTTNSGEEDVLGKNGFFLQADFNEADLARILEELLERRPVWGAIASAAYVHVQQNFNWSRQAEHIVNFLKSV